MAQVSAQPSHHVSERQNKHQTANWKAKSESRIGDGPARVARRIVLVVWHSCGPKGTAKRNQQGMTAMSWVLQLLAAALLGYGVGIAKVKDGHEMVLGSQVRIKNLHVEHGRDFRRPGLSHLTLWGASQDSMKQVEVWMQTFAPGAGTPIHRHDNEEIFLVNHGQASIRWQRAGEKTVMESAVPKNGTFVVPSNVVHQIWNYGKEDVQVTVVIGNPPIRIYLYEHWNMRYDQGKLKHPYIFDV